MHSLFNPAHTASLTCVSLKMVFMNINFWEKKCFMLSHQW